MNKRFMVFSAAFVLIASLAAAATPDGSWTGWITDTQCGAKGANSKHADCAKKCVEGQGAKYALFNPADKKVYTLDPQDKAVGHAGQYVTVKGTVQGDTIKVASIEMTPEPNN